MDRVAIARELGLPVQRVTDRLLQKIATDSLFLHHLILCKDDPELQDILLRETAVIVETSESAKVAGSTPELIGRAGIALARWIASGFERVSEDKYVRRMEACNSCEHLSASPDKAIYRLMGGVPEIKAICGLCGCDVRRKAWPVTENCPDGRWGL